MSGECEDCGLHAVECACGTDVTDRARSTFISMLGESCNVSEACRAAGISRNTAYRWRKEESEFAALWEDAEQTAADRLEQVAWERATTGQSDRLMELLLKAHRPEKFKERVANEHSGAIQITKVERLLIAPPAKALPPPSHAAQ